MRRPAIISFASVAILAAACVCAAPTVQAMDPRQPRAADETSPWLAMTVAQARQAVRDEMASRHVAADVRQEVEGLWEEAPADAGGETLLHAALASLALIDPRAAALTERLTLPLSSPPVDDDWLLSSEADTFLPRQLRLAYGRWLCRAEYYDDAIRMLDGLDAAQVVQPAGLLFYRAVAHQRLAQREAGLADAHALLTRVADVPVRYRAVAELVRRDLEPLKDDSLDLISRRMEDVRRRLALGQGGQPTRQVEDEVLAALDKLIQDLEDQQKQQQEQQSAGASGQGSNRPGGTPANNSRIMGGSGPGETTPRDIGSRSGWGDLPPKARQEALQQIGRDFPAHYRDIVEQYFRRLAQQAEGQSPADSPE